MTYEGLSSSEINSGYKFNRTSIFKSLFLPAIASGDLC